VANKKGCLGCSLPVVIGISLVVVALVVVGLLAGPIGKAFGIEGLPEWMTLHQPAPKLPAETAFHIFNFGVTNTILATWITMAFLIIFFLIATRRMKLIPGRLQSIFESILQYIYDLVVSIAGEKLGRTFFPLIATIFLFVGCNAWLALIPGYGSLLLNTSEGHIELIRGANTDLNTTLALALITFSISEFMGFKRLGLGYLKKFFPLGGMINGFKLLFKMKIGQGLLGLLSGFVEFFTGIIELLGDIIRIISLSFRLFGNMTAGEILLVSVAFLVPYLVPMVFYGLEVLVGYIQALVFSSLAIVYINMAVAAHEGEEAHH
jgi:F-type H+-transporting ATPase subunit a